MQDPALIVLRMEIIPRNRPFCTDFAGLVWWFPTLESQDDSRMGHPAGGDLAPTDKRMRQSRTLRSCRKSPFFGNSVRAARRDYRQADLNEAAAAADAFACS
jgi:hypothetical protein